jgi:L-seryl-tRNA(Ser) seleniumtransferase
MSPNPLRNFPSMHELLENPRLKSLVHRVSRSSVVSTVGTFLDEVRKEVQTAASEMNLPNIADLADRIVRRILESDSSQFRPAINATGVLFPARSNAVPLAEEAIEEMDLVARDFTGFDSAASSGRPSFRNPAVESLLRELCGAEAALAVPSKSTALILALTAMAKGREVIVARNHLVENDDGCRVADLIVGSGAALREVGAVNHVRLDDYTQAMSDATAAVLVAHPSNYAMTGNSGDVNLRELADAAKRRKIPAIHDVGLGGLLDFSSFGFAGEPVVAESLQAGVDLVVLSGDKLLGGPQCGILVGSNVWLEQIEQHPLAQAFHADKLTLAALAATLRKYRDPENARRTIPLLQLLTASVENLKNRAERLAAQAAAVPAIAEAKAVEGESDLTGLALPNRRSPTWCLALRPATMSVERLATALCEGEPSVIGRMDQDRLLLDLRSVFPRQDVPLLSALNALKKSNEGSEEKGPEGERSQPSETVRRDESEQTGGHDVAPSP